MNNIDISLVNINNTDKDFIHYCQEKMDCFLVIKGFVTIGVNNEEYILKENDIIVTNNGDRYYLVGNESNIVIKMTIDIDYLSEIYSEIRSYTFLCNPKDEKISSGNKYVNLKSSISKILYINLEKKKGYKFELFSQFFDFIKYLLINFGIKNRQINEIIKADKDFSNIKKYISCNYNKTITLTDLAKKNYISPQYFSKLFKSKIGIGFHKYITNIRIDNSIQDLLFTDETIVNVALKNGFPSSKSFSTNFKDRYKLTPTEYRLKNQDKIKYSEFEVKEFNPSSTDTIMELKRYIKKYELFKTEMNPKNDLDMIKINLDLDSKEYLDVPTPIINILNIDFLENDITIQQLKYVKDKFNVKYVYFSAFDDIKIENVLGHSPLKLYGIYKYLDPLYIQKLYPFFKIDFSNVYFKVLKGLFTLKEYYEYLEQSLNSIVKIFPLYYISDFKFEITNDSFVNQKDYIDFYNNCYRIIKKSLGEVSIGIKTFYNRFEPSKKEIIELLEKSANNLDFITFSCDPTEYVNNLADEGIKEISSYSDFLINDISTILFKYGINDIPIYMLDWNTVTSSDSTALSGTFFRSAIIFESILKNYNDLNGIGFYLDTYRTIVEREDKNEGILGLFLTLKIKRPIFFVLDIFHKINHNKILYRNDNILITQENDKEYNIVIYNPNYIHPLLSVDYKFTEQLTKEISIVIKNFIDGYYQIKKFIYDNSSDGIYSHIDKLGFPGYIDEEIVEYLENSIAPKLTIINIHINGDFNLNVDLKFNSIVFYRIKKIN